MNMFGYIFMPVSIFEEGMATYSSVLAWRIPWTGAWHATVYGVTKSRIQLKQLSMHACMNTFFKNVQPQIFFLTINANLTFYYVCVDFEVQILMSEKK